jgi:hypothetical protein
MDPNYADDIPLDVARSAHHGTSFDPERRGTQERSGYATTLSQDFAHLSNLATTDEKKATLETEFARYREGFRKRTLAHLSAKSRCFSTMITGPSNFPVRRHAKANAAEDRRRTELLEFRERALKAIRKVLQPELAPIMAGDGDALTRLREKLANLERSQETMKAANAAIRKHAKAGRDAQVAALIEVGLPETEARELLKPGRFAGDGFAHFTLTNNGAEIRRCKKRIESIGKAQALPAVEVETESGIRLEDSPAENRIRIFFPGKPDEAVRTAMKQHGFRWSPTIGAWQAYRNHGSLQHARKVAGLDEEASKAPPPPWTPTPGARVFRRELPSHRGEVVSYHPEGVGCDNCIGKIPHVVVRWEDSPGQWDEDPEDLAPIAK